MSDRARRIAVVTHADPGVAHGALVEALAVCSEEGVKVVASDVEFEKHGETLGNARAERLTEAGSGGKEPDICIVLGGDGTMLRAFNVMRGRGTPVAGVNLGRVGFLTTVDRDQIGPGLRLLLAGAYDEYHFPGLEAECEGGRFQAANDVVVSKGDRAPACLLGLTINGVALFEVSCDGVVVATPAGSSAYSMAAGGPLLGITVEAYVISLVAAHAVGVRPVVAGPTDILQIANNDRLSCYLDIDGQRVRQLLPDAVVTVSVVRQMNSLALLRGDSLYHHFRDRLL